MPKYGYKSKIVNSSLYVENFMKAFFTSQGIKPHLPLKSEIIKGIKQPNYNGNYKIWNYAMPYDIEKEHLKRNRDKIRSMPIDFSWTESEIKEYEKLPSDDLKRKMILDKVDMKSLYLPNLKFEKDFINYPPLPTDEKSKNNFAKGFGLYTKKDAASVNASIPYLESSAAAGNYIYHELLGRYYLSVIKNLNNTKSAEWEKAYKKLMEHSQWLCKVNLPVGYYLISEYDIYHTNLNKNSLSQTEIKSIYNNKIYPNMIKALSLGSYDLMYQLAANNMDLEWALTLMLLTGESHVISGMIKSLKDRIEIPVTPRNMATIKLALMLGSHTTLEIFLGRGDTKNTYMFNRNFKSCFFYQDPTPEYNYTLLSKSSQIVSTLNTCEKYLNEKSFLIPEIDKCIPNSTVLFSPYGNIESLFSMTDYEYNGLIDDLGYYEYENSKDFPKEKILSLYKDFQYKDPRSKFSTLKHKKLYREALEENDSDNALDDNDVFGPEDKEFAKERIEKLVERSENNTLSEHIYEFISYANALKKRELEMNPYYYKLASPYIFPEEVYKNKPNWY